MKINAYLSFPGNCAEAMNFYKECFGGGSLNVRTHRGSPTEESTPPEMLDTVMHAHLEVEGVILMGADVPAERYTAPSPMVQLMLSVATDERAEQLFAALREDGTVLMPLQQTFWTSRFGMLKDKFGVPWMVGSEQTPA